ncbi:MAG: DUF4230 domain-containing protein [Thermoanaerobaculia bacterium]
MTYRRGAIAAGAVLVALAVIVSTALIIWRVARQSVVDTVTKRVEKTVDVATLVTQVRELNRLETASMRVLHIGTTTQSYKLIPDAVAGDEITFLAAGDVIAGIDLSRLRPGDVWREDGDGIAMRIPPPQILVTRVDNRESRVLKRSTGALRRADVDLETRARQHAETNIRAEALKKGILTLASQNAEKKLAEFMHALGIQKVRFVSTPAPAER